jgi:Ribbon-helix-helix protein, copG family.
MTNVERRTIRVDGELWERVGEVARQLRTTRSEMIRSYLLWLVGTPGARPPSRPALDNVDSGQGS